VFWQGLLGIPLENTGISGGPVSRQGQALLDSRPFSALFSIHMQKLLLAALAAFASLTACAQTPSSTAAHMTASAAQASPAATKAPGIWIDVRTPEEYGQGHLKDAANIPLQEFAERIQSAVPDKNAAVHLYCRSGRRSGQAEQIMRELGYKNVTNQGGYEDLKAQGLS